MPQYHYAQFGIVHVTTNAHGKQPWCTMSGIPDILIETLFLVRSLQKAKLYAFCILPTHAHLILSPGEKGLSSFMHSFKTNSSKNVKSFVANLQITATRCRSCGSDDNPHSIPSRSGNNDDHHSIRSRGIVPRNSQPIFTGWQKGYHDEVIRTSEQFGSTLAYVQYNAAKHKIVANFMDWPWSSFHFQKRLDLAEVWTD
jgi:REP element-mobilizing transposase RayT